ncbi:MAG: prepilin-type N-terminal cleavage/methylation domain-containing protein [Alphaproteobacteria bacterium]|nr:prepilin-type N-terminal cleavage/methylation domain-containing protein [Alphaproteobacteria bacterium]
MRRTRPIFRKTKKGFSLVEIAIAVLVVSLIATFSLKGKELIRTAKLRAVIEQVETFRIAANSFSEKYGAIPGDLKNAKELIDESLENGKGNGEILSKEDAKRFWNHLSKSGLIGIELVNGYPISKIGGYFSVSSKIEGRPGIWLILSKGTGDNQNFSGIMTTESAYYIDRSTDNGLPLEGDVQIMKGQYATGECIVESKYNFKNKNEDCVVLFRIW